MKTSFDRLSERSARQGRTGRLLAYALTLTALLPAGAQVRSASTNELQNFDMREPVGPSAARATANEQGKARLQSLLPTAKLDFDALLGTPKFVHATDGFLSGPNGRGRGISAAAAQAVPATDPYQPIKSFLLDNSNLFGFGPAALEAARIKRDYTNANNGLHTVAWEQLVDGIPVFRSVLIGHITRKGELVNVSSLFMPNASAAADAGTPNRGAVQAAPPVTALQAVQIAGTNLGAALSLADIRAVGGPVGDGSYLVFKAPRETYVRPVWLPLNESSLRLSWEVLANRPATGERFWLVLDAQTGQVYFRQSMNYHISDASYYVFTGESPSPFSPSLQAPGTYQPPLVSQILVTTAALDTNASPDGWIDDANNTTTGNNIDAFVDRDATGTPSSPRPVGNPFRIFDFTNDLTQDPSNYVDGSVVQMFWRANWYHDRLYELGFTEAAGNYQMTNFGRGGIGGDPIICHAQYGADVGITDNDMFQPAPDGMSGNCYMFVFDGPTPERDGALDSQAECHELTHGTSWRLVGGGMELGTTQSDGMGEGWSDFYALTLLNQAGADPNEAYCFGGYSAYEFAGLIENYYFGIRRYPYCTDMSINPLTFKDIDPTQISPHAGVPLNPILPFDPTQADEVHNEGEVWCVTLWELHANLIAQYGWNIANELELQLVTDGMKLTPPTPNYLQARDAILQADKIDNGGTNQALIWRAFAKRGMGVSATAPVSTTSTGVVEAYDLPGLEVDHVVVSGGNGNGQVDEEECNDLRIFLRNNTAITATNIIAELSTTNVGVIVVQGTATYASISGDGTNGNLTAFRISTEPNFVCGTPIIFELQLKSSLGAATNQFTLPTGAVGEPVRFDSLMPVSVPDAGATNSPILVSNITYAVQKVTVSLYMTELWDSDVLIQLVSPDGATNTLSQNEGFGGVNFGAACSPDTLRTTFDDDATIAISQGYGPFIGSYIPDQPLSMFVGKSGTNVNGVWQLLLSDPYYGDMGTVQCWSLYVTPTICTNGGGECPSADLALGMTAQPEPVIQGNNLTYTIWVTNFGPSITTNVTVSQTLPVGGQLLTVTPSQGGWSEVNGVLACGLGRINPGAAASIVVVVEPILTGWVSSQASVASEQPDPNLLNNAATLYTLVNPPTADIAVGMTAPSSVSLGNPVPYTVTVANNGPSAASGVSATCQLPSNVAILSAQALQGAVTVSSNIVIWNGFGLAPAGQATLSITAFPGTAGQVVATATASANQFDPVATNNTATVTTIVGASADLALSLSAFPSAVVMGSNLTYTVIVTNLGPSSATGVSVTTFLPTNVTRIVSSTSSQGSISVVSNIAVANLGSLGNGSIATNVIVVAAPTTNLLLIASADVAGNQADPNPTNNTASVSTVVAKPFISLVPAGAVLTYESGPTNGAINSGETVTVQLLLLNTGNVPTTNLVATLQTNSGVTPATPNSSRTYGHLLPGFVSSGVPGFTFTASGGNGAVIAAVLHATDASGFQTNVTFNFTLASTNVFANTNVVTIPEQNSAQPYPSAITVSGLTGVVSKVTATLNNLSHSYTPDIDALLVGPTGEDTILMSGAGWSTISNVTVTFDDAAATPVPDDDNLLSTSYSPADYLPGTNLPSPAPSGPYVASMSVFNGSNPNGVWSLYVDDNSYGSAGVIAGGWSLTVVTIVPVSGTADLAISGLGASGSVTAGNNVTNTFIITNRGPDAVALVSFTNSLPSGVSLVTSSSSQGSLTVAGSSIVGNLGALSAGASATVSLVLVPQPSAVGLLTNTAGVFASSGEIDLNPGNNTASVVTSVGLPVADVAVGQTAAPSPVTIGSNLTFTLTVTNNGPQTALSVVLSNALPANVSVISNISTLGTPVVQGGAVSCAMGNLAAGAGASVTLVVAPTVLAPLTNRVYVSTASYDSNLVNNSASVVVPVVPLAPEFALVGVTMISQSGPVDGAVDPGQTNTVSFALLNYGGASTAPDFSVTLEPGPGLTVLSGPTNCGALKPGATAYCAFTFSATGASGGSVTAVLQLTNAGASLGTVSNVFTFPVPASFANSAFITIPDHGTASPYPSTISVAGLSGQLSKVTVALNELSHTFPSDINVLVVSPSGQSALIMSHAGGETPVVNATLTFDDASSNALSFQGPLTTSTNQPEAYSPPSSLPGAPSGPYTVPLSLLNGQNPNGVWSLYVYDDSPGDAGSIAGGWSLTLTTVTPITAVADLAVGFSSVPTALYSGDRQTNTILVTNLGPSTASNVLVTTGFLPPSVLLISSAASQGSWSQVSSNEGSWSMVGHLGTLSSGSTANLGFVTESTQGLSFPQVATVSSDQLDPNYSNNSATTETDVTSASPTLYGSAEPNRFTLSFDAPSGLKYVIQTSTNLTSWTPLATNTVVGGTIKFTDSNVTSLKYRFYRAVRQVP